MLTGTHYGDVRTSWLADGTAVRHLRAAVGHAGGPRHPWVDVDGAAGTAAATRHLLDAGHRRIGFIGWPAGSGVGDDRRAGWARALVAAGVDPTGLDAGVGGRRGRRRGAWRATCSTPAPRPRWSA